MSLAATRVLVVEDQRDMAETIRDNLVQEGHGVDVVGDGEAAIDAALRNPYDLVLLDVMLPSCDGYEVCERIRRRGHRVPVLFLTARHEPGDRVRGFEAGGDDYLPKPFDLRELLLRVDALIRRGAATVPEPRVRFGDNQYEVGSARAIDWSGGGHRLAPREARVLELFLDRPGETLRRDEILDHAWGDDVRPSMRTIDEIVARLRRRFERDPEQPVHFRSVSRSTYRFVRDADEGSDV